MFKRNCSRWLALFVVCLLCSVAAFGQRRKPQKPQVPRICGDPTVRCNTDNPFQPYNLPFAVRINAGPIQETEPFYAVVLKTLRSTDANCERIFVPERERLEVQKLFPHNKVFTDRCPEPGDIYYTGYDFKIRLLGIYGGSTQAEANAILKQIKAKYPQAVVRRMRAGFNGT